MRCSWLLTLLLLATPSLGSVDTLHVRSDDYDVVWIAETDSTGSATVIDLRSSRTVLTARLTAVHARHFHPVEYHNGHLYALHLTGDYRWPSHLWTEELWRYQGSKRRTRVFSDQGIDFRVAPNESVIVVGCGGEENGRLVFLSPGGSVIRTILASDLRLDYIGTLWVTNQFVFVSPGGPEAGLDRLVRIGLRDSSVTVFELHELAIDVDFDFDPERQMIVGSDCPAFVDAEEANEWRSTRPLVALHLYSLATRSDTILATSVAKDFRPQWVREGVVEFTDPTSGKRVSRSVGQHERPH